MVDRIAVDEESDQIKPKENKEEDAKYKENEVPEHHCIF